MRWSLTLVLVMLAAPVRAQQQPPQPPPTFRTAVRLVVQPVTVKDRNGKAIEGLTARDFTLTEDGRPQEIAFVEFQPLDTIGSAAPLPATTTTVAPVTAGAGSPSLPGGAAYRGRRLLIIYLDLVGMPFFDQFRAFDSADKYVATLMTPADLVAVMVYDGRGARMKQNFTDDRAALRGAIHDLMTAADERENSQVAWDPGGAFGEDDESFNLFTSDRQLAALQTAVSGLGSLPELKTLVYFGSGLRMNGADNLAQLRATINAAVRANVTLNPVDARGLVATAPLGDATRASPGGIGMFSGALAEAATTRFQRSQDTLYALAKDTGGKALLDNNDLSLGIVQAARAVTGYYLIGYYTSNTATDGRYRRVKISVTTASTADLSYRPGYYGAKEFARFTRADKEMQLADALRLEDTITDIPMAMEVNYFQLNGAEYFVPVSVRMPGSELIRPPASGAARLEIDMIGELKDEFGVTHRNVRDRIEIPPATTAAAGIASRPIQYETGFTVLPGNYVIKVLARNDATGRIGTFQTSFAIPNLDRERIRLPISSVVLTNQRVSRSDALHNVRQKISSDAVNPLVHDGQRLVPGVTRTFSAGRPLFVFLQAYEREASSMHPLVASVMLVRDGVKIFESDPLAIAGEWDPSSRAVPIRFTVPLRGLPPGSYACQVTVLDPTTRRAAFWRGAIVVIP
jgi:VWFA-related protein